MNCPENRLRDSELGAYNPLTFIIRLNPPDAEVLPGAGDSVRVRLTAQGQATLWHEYAHFMQTVSTFQGVGELLNWFDVQLDLAKDGLAAIRGGVGEVTRSPERFPNLSASMSQRAGIIGLMYFKPERDLRFSSPQGSEDFGLFLGESVSGTPSMWLRLPFEAETKAIRITRDFFAEAMGRAVGDLALDAGIPDTRTALGDAQIVYYALRSYLEHHLRNVDSRLAAVVVGDACLFSDLPQDILRRIHALVTGGRASEVEAFISRGDSIGLARLCNPFFDSEYADYKMFLDDRISGLQSAQEGEPGFYIRILWQFVRENLDVRIQSRTLSDSLLSDKSWEAFVGVSKKFGCPLVNVGPEFLDPSGRKVLQDAWLHFLAGTQIFDKAFLKSAGACVFFESPSCKHTAKGRCCETDILNVPADSAGKACVVTRVADIMGLRGV